MNSGTEKKIINPDELIITIRTSIPGYQKIEYKPSMTIQNSDEKAVLFNPLIKLNKSKIDKIPQDIRAKSFLNKSFFNSLLTQNEGTPAKNLLQATRYGYIDNNIKVTIDNLFMVGSVIYIGNNPYVIGDVQWTISDWYIEIKKKEEEINPSTLKQQEINDYKISGKEQLKDIPQNFLTGINYTGPPITQNTYPINNTQSTNITNLEMKNIPKLAYAITIDMELHAGTTLTPEQLSKSKCNSKYNAIRKAFAEFTGRPYTIQPVYSNNTKSNKSKSVTTIGGKTRKRKNKR